MGAKQKGMARAACCVILTALLLLAAAPAAMAEDGGEKWEFLIVPYMWAIGLDADTTVKGVDATVDMDFGDVLDKLDMAFIGYLEARRRPWSFYVDCSYLDVSDSGYTRISKIDYSSRSTILEIGAAYEAVSQPLAGGVLALDALVAGRAYKMHAEIKFPRLGNFSDDKSWVDPVIGARLRLAWPAGWFVNARADIGGFGVSSDLTYKLEALAGYWFTQTIAAFAGFRDLYYDYQDGEGRQRFALKGHIYGPLIGLSIHF